MHRYIHISARLTTVIINNTPQMIVARPGTTFRAGRNAEKRAARADSRLRVDMLVERRLRQRQAA